MSLTENSPLQPRPKRRTLLKLIAGGFAAMASAAAGVPILAFFFHPWLHWQEDQWVDVGPIDHFAEGQTQPIAADNPVLEPWAGVSGRVAMYVRRKEGKFTVFAVNCAHLECPVAWFPESGLFLCPCHGGVYTEDGTNVAGPPPRPLFQYKHRVENGKLLVRLGHLPNLSEPA